MISILQAEAATEATQEGGRRSLSELQDIVLPPEISAWPPAPGWWVLLAAVLISGAILVTRALVRHRALAYRRAALDEFRELVAAGDLSPLPALLKRVALAVYPRAQVASLAGDDWVDFLGRTAGTAGFPKAAGRHLIEIAYVGRRVRVEDASAHELTAAVEAWIRAQGPAHGEGSG